jgi:tetratricopeptide (TPR) repeat protein
MSKIHRIGGLALALSVALSGALFAVTQGRLRGTVSDETAKPLAGVKITVTTSEVTDYKQEVTTDAKGRFAIVLNDATRTYTYRFDKEGYQSLEEAVKIPAGSNTEKNFTIVSMEAAQKKAQAEGQAQAAETPENKAAAAFNEGATAFNAQDYATAKTKFQEALALNPSLTQAYQALGRVHLAEKNYQEAAAMAEKVLALAPADAKAQALAYEAYIALGDKAKAKQFEQALAAANPKVAAVNFYNQGAELFNAGKPAEALPMLEKALAADAENPKIHNLLGLCYVNMGNNAKAKEHFEKFIAMAPNDPEAAAAKEMLQYLK